MIRQTAKSICTITMILFCTMGYAQQFDVEISEGAEILRGYQPQQTVKSQSGEYLVFGTAPPQKFGRVSSIHDYLTFPSLRTKDEANVEIKVPFKKTYSYDFLQNSKELVRIIVTKDKQEKKIKKHFQKFDEFGKHIGIKEYAVTTYDKYDDLPTVGVIYSDDNKNALILDNYDEDESNVDFKAGFTVVNSDLEVIHTYDYVGEGSQKMNNILSVNVDNEGNFSFLIKKYKNKKAKEVIKEGKVKVPGYEYFLVVKKKDEQIEEVKIDLKNSFVRGGIYTTNSNGDFVLFFPYDSDYKENTAVGFYGVHVDGVTKEVTNNKHVFSSEEITHFGTWKKSKPGLDEKFWLLPYVAKDENQIVFAMERLKKEGAQGGISMAHMSLICFTLDNKGKYKEFMHVPKCYSVMNAINLAQMKFFNGQLHVIYMDNYKNFERDIKDYNEMKSTWSRKKDFLYYAIKENGKVKRKLISESLNGGFMNAGTLKIEEDKLSIPYVDVGGDDVEMKIVTLTEKPFK